VEKIFQEIDSQYKSEELDDKAESESERIMGGGR